MCKLLLMMINDLRAIKSHFINVICEILAKCSSHFIILLRIVHKCSHINVQDCVSLKKKRNKFV